MTPKLQAPEEIATPRERERWTPQQREAIEDREHDLFVTAAAGSGKTAVLTERVLRLVSEQREDGSAPAPLERLLVITFTRKAAREMRARIEESIVQGLRAEPDHARLGAALDALPRSNIMTLDAFCDRLVRTHFHHAHVSPAVRVADEEEQREIDRLAARRVFEGLYGAEDELGRDFDLLLRIGDRSGGRGHLDRLAEQIDRVRVFVASLDKPRQWLQAATADMQRALEAGRYDDLPEAKFVARVCGRSVGDWAEALTRLAGETRRLAGAEAEPPTESWLAAAEALRAFSTRLTADGGESVFALMREIEQWNGEKAKFLLKLKNKSVCGAALFSEKVFCKERLAKFSSRFERWIKDWFSLGTEHWLEAAKMSARQGLALLRVAERVTERADEIKRQRGVLGFADLERKTLEVLTDPGGEGPSDVSKEYQDLFEHVLVDEYQDISPLQEAIIRRLSRVEDPSPNAMRNLFVVGDVKQSIYRFRRADPGLFARWLRRAPLEPGPGERLRRIALQSNFRSRPAILECVNAVFERLMDREVGEIEYDEEARLVAERPQVEVDTQSAVEAHWIDAKAVTESGTAGEADEEASEEALSAVEREARWIAARIKEMTHPVSGELIPAERGELRRARPGDCAVLVRALSNHVDTWVTTFARFGLQVSTAGRDPLLTAPELADAIAALRLADNPLDDVALASVLRGPMVGLDEEELLALRRVHRHGPFHGAVWLAAGRPWPDDARAAEGTEPSAVDPELTEKLGRFLARLERWRMLAERGGAEEVLNAIVHDTGFEAYLGGLPGGLARRRSLDYLRGLIRGHGERAEGSPSLGDFLRAYDESDGGTAREDEGELLDGRAVSLLTIHKSKGLEFPIVFLARLGTRFSDSRNRGEFELDSVHGMAISAVHPERRVRLIGPGLTAMRAESFRAGRAEELRLLYVAMTRAREKLILVGTVATDCIEERWERSGMNEGSTAPALERLTAATPADLLGPILQRIAREGRADSCLIQTHDRLPEGPKPTELSAIGRALGGVEGALEDSWRAARADFIEQFKDDPRAARAIEHLHETERIDPPPPNRRLIVPGDPMKGLSGIRLKRAASELGSGQAGSAGFALGAGEADEIEAVEHTGAREGRFFGEGALASRVPAFALLASEAQPLGAARGRLTHALLQHVDLRGALDQDGLRKQAEALLKRGLLPAERTEELDAIDLRAVARFFSSDLGARLIARPGAVLRELPFTRWVTVENSLGEIECERLGLSDEDRQRRLLVQGMIDCLIDEGDRAVLIDYKTDRLGANEHARGHAEKYFAQIDAYRQAIRTTWRLPVSEAYLVFLDAGANVLVDGPPA